MEQRTYTGNVSPEGLADYLVQEYSQRRHTTAQKIGQGNSFLVQIGDDLHHHEDRPSATVGITRPTDSETGLVVTMGEQQWVTSDMAGHAIMTGLIGALFTPWALWSLLGPASRMLGNQMLPDELWSTIETYIIGMGGAFAGSHEVTRPQAQGGAAPPAPASAPEQQAIYDPEKTQRLG
jgi:hypothetical protein